MKPEVFDVARNIARRNRDSASHLIAKADEITAKAAKAPEAEREKLADQADALRRDASDYTRTADETERYIAEERRKK